jgi:hypothetical protein
MSEYQYYEWQAIDRLLTPDEQAAVDRLSSHIDVTSSYAMVDYQWGDFKHDPKQVLLKYFDAHLYLANWGSRRLLFRFPKGLLDENALKPYCIPYHISFETFGDYQVLDLELDEEEGVGWVEAQGVLSTFTRLRDDLIRGDFRLLYLAWLKAMTLNPFWDEDVDHDAEMEPPVPAGLKQLTPALNCFVQTFDLDPILVQVAAENSLEYTDSPEQDYASLVSKLSREECNDFLTRLANDEPGIAYTLRKRLMVFIRKLPVEQSAYRTVGQLFEQQEAFRQEKRKRKAQAAQRAYIARMKDLAKYEPQMWPEIERLLKSYTPKVYDEVTAQLVELKQLAVFQGRVDTFQSRMKELRERYKTRRSLIERWDRNGLC